MYTQQLMSIALLVAIVLRSADSALTREQMEKTARGLRSSCVDKIHADMNLVQGIRRGEFAEDENVKCYMLCIMKKLRTFKNGQVDVDMVRKQVELMMPIEVQERVKASATKCGAIAPSENPCETAFQYSKCSYENDPEVFFFP